MDSALQAASGKTRANVVQLLLDAGAEFHGDESLEASKMASEEVVRLLLDGGAEIDGKALLVAIERP